MKEIESNIRMNMKTNESQKEIGMRIAQMRKRKGLSQEELAVRVKLSRPSLAQIELGNRGINIQEFQRFAQVLEFSLDNFVSKDFHVSAVERLADDQGVQQIQERISVPKLQVSKFKQVLLYILEHCAGKPNVGETVLYKLLYFSDFNYYELYEEQLTGANYRKLPYGPVPQKLDQIIEQMRMDGQLERIKTNYHGFSQTRYFPLVKADLRTFKASEKEVIDRVIEQMSDWSASAISDYSHKDIPWLATKEGEEINYELAFYREAPFSVRNYDEKEEE